MVKFIYSHSQIQNGLCLEDNGAITLSDLENRVDLLLEIINFIVNEEATHLFTVGDASYLAYRSNVVVSPTGVCFYNCIKYFN